MAQLPGNGLHDGSLFEKKGEDMRDALAFWVRSEKMHLSALDMILHDCWDIVTRKDDPTLRLY
jgi:hypothetical protein